MKISCPSCSAAYELDDARVPPAGLSIKCPKCKSPFTVHKPKPGEGGKIVQGKPAGGAPAAGGKVPLPGTGQAGRAPGQGRAVGAVPLPGTGEAGSSSPSTPGAVPLPGMDEDLANTMTRAAPSAGGVGALPDLDDPLPAPDSDALVGSDQDAGFGSPPEETAITPRDETAVAPKHQTAKKGGLEMGDDSAAGLNFDFVDPPGGAPPGASGQDPGEEPATIARRPAPHAIGSSAGDGLASFADEPLQVDPDPPAAEDPNAEKERRKRERAEEKAREREEKARRKAERSRGEGAGGLLRLRNVAAVLLLAGLGTGAFFGVRARQTPAGLFWMNVLVPARRSANATEVKVIEAGMQKLAQGDFIAAREALASSAQLLGVIPYDDDAKAFFILAASELKLGYGQLGGDWDQAKRAIEKLTGTRPQHNRARAAFALASGDLARGKQLLASLGDGPSADAESAWLFAEALRREGDTARAAQVLDGMLKGKGQGSTKLLLLRGAVARERGQLAEAADLFQKALDAAPQNGRCLVALAEVKLRRGETAKAAELLQRALDTDVHKSLNAGDEGRGNMLRGRILALGQPKEAEAAFERAVNLDATSAEIRQAYGEFRLGRREWDKAARQFDAALSAGTATADILAGAARAYMSANRLVDADKRIAEAVAKDPGPHVLFVQGKVAEALGKQEEAMRAYDKALQKKPDSAETLIAQAGILLSRANQAKAKERIDAALKLPEADRSSMDEQAVGEVLLGLGDRHGAREAYARALHKNPDDPMAHAGMGRALAALGELKAARKELEKALGQLDVDPALYYEYGSLLRRMNDSEGAIASLQKAVKLDSKEPRYRARLGAVLVETKQYDEAERHLRQAALMNDRFGEAQYFLARALAGRRNLAEAVSMMRRAVDLEPENPEYLYHLGIVYEMGQQVQDAVEALQKSLEKAPHNIDAWDHLAANLMVENRFHEAATALRKAVELDRSRPRLWAALAEAEQQSGNLEGAVRDYQKALAMDPRLPGTWTKLGITFKDWDCKGCRVRAVDALRRATLVDPTDALAHHQLGYMYKDDGRRNDAIAEFKKYLQLKPSAGDAATVQDDIYYLQEEARRAP